MTFNYDVLLEDALRAVKVDFPCISAYASGGVEVFKLHGSTDWRCMIPARLTNLRKSDPSELELIEEAPAVPSVHSIFAKKNEHVLHAGPEVYYDLPALAIPVLAKSEYFCPSAHVATLEERIPLVDKIAIVGWRGREHNFVRMLAAGLGKPVSVLAACGTKEASQEPLANLVAVGIEGQFDSYPGGFTELVLSRRIEAFLKV